MKDGNVTEAQQEHDPPASSGEQNPEPMEEGDATAAANPQTTEELLSSVLLDRIEEQDARQQELEVLVASQAREISDLKAALLRVKQGGHGAKLSPKDPIPFSGEDKGSVDDWIQAMSDWLATGPVASEMAVAMART